MLPAEPAGNGGLIDPYRQRYSNLGSKMLYEPHDDGVHNQYLL